MPPGASPSDGHVTRSQDNRRSAGAGRNGSDCVRRAPSQRLSPVSHVRVRSSTRHRWEGRADGLRIGGFAGRCRGRIRLPTAGPAAGRGWRRPARSLQRTVSPSGSPRRVASWPSRCAAMPGPTKASLGVPMARWVWPADQGLGHEALRPAQYQITTLIHLTSVMRPGGHDGQMATQHADVWPHISWTPGRNHHGHLAARCPGLTEPASRASSSSRVRRSPSAAR
jgi:hypothetical protein